MASERVMNRRGLWIGWRPAWRKLQVLVLGLLLSSAVFAADSACPTVLQHTMPNLLDERPVSLCDYRGKVVLVVNTASYCGYTPQYEGLQALHERWGKRGLVILGFPSNDFGRQEPGDGKQIREFCDSTYAVRFPMFAKTRVVGGGAHPFFQQLAQRAGAAPQWNFHKYLIDRKGEQVLSFGSQVAPDDRRLVAQIDALLR